MSDRVGQQLGNYRLIRLLGEGGFAEVYLGEHIHLGTEAAIKVLTARLSSDEIEQFRNEARTIARLKHPRIIRVLDFGVDNGTPFLVMDYVSNGTLRQHFPKGTQLPPETILPLVTQIAAALQYAHDQQLIHRDIKPENMLLDGENVLLSDFGIAVVAHSSRSMNTQDQVGTLPYMAPEQLQGKPRLASDQYALGVVVYEWLTGTRPFNGMSWEIVSQHFSTPPPPMREKVPTLSPMVEQVVLKALVKEHERRFTTVQEFAQAFAAAVGPFNQITYAPTIPPVVKVAPPQVANPFSHKTKEQWIDEGITYFNAGRHAEAIAACNQAIALDSNDPNAHYGRGVVYQFLKQYKLALVDYTRALELDPKYANAYYGRGVAYRNLKEYRWAIDDYTRALKLDPKYTNAYGGRGLAYYYLNDYQHAIQDFDQALQLDPSITWFKSEREDAYRKLRRK